ncbi:MAG: cell division protein ZapA [Kangiellaceae bacterium]|nr:cell division protein ZapA [Kangiellaceae bacterium]MCW8999849.1 cell division protein ZapA [Kangiellaceae bacterium]MCW9016625.1 cell division protein ZapA [Kangiellaceae bacterium]
MSDIKPVTVHIMGNEYHVSSPEDQVEKLETAARELDKRMREIKSGGRIVGVERIAVMAALNMAYELIHGEPQSLEMEEKIAKRISKLQKDIDSALASSAQMELT